MNRNRLNSILGWSVVAGAIAVLLRRVWLMELDSFEFDDAFMFIRYAENLISGNGFTWNPGDSNIFGCTSILYTFVVAAIKLVTGSFLSNSQILVASALIFGLAFLAIMQQGLVSNLKNEFLRNRLVIAAGTIPLLAFPLIFGFHISTGMETTMSLFLHASYIFVILRMARYDHRGWSMPVLAALTGYLLFLCRPDNLLTVVLFPPILFLAGYGNLRTSVRCAMILALLLTGDAIIKWQVFGSVMPLSFYAKRSGFSEGYTASYFWNPFKYLTQLAAYLMPYIIVLFLFMKRNKWLFLAAFLVPVFLTFGYYFTFDQIMGFNARLYFPFIPYFIIPAFMLLDEGLDDLRKGLNRNFNLDVIFLRFLLLVIFLVPTVFSKYRLINWFESRAIAEGNKGAVTVPGLEDRKFNREQSIKLISKVINQFPAEFRFAATEHGYISAECPGIRIFDLSGLQNKEIALHGYSDDLLRQEHPDFIWMPHQDLTVLHKNVREGEYFRSDYEYFTNVFAFGCAIRRDSPYYDQLRETILSL